MGLAGMRRRLAVTSIAALAVSVIWVPPPVAAAARPADQQTQKVQNVALSRPAPRVTSSKRETRVYQPAEPNWPSSETAVVDLQQAQPRPNGVQARVDGRLEVAAPSTPIGRSPISLSAASSQSPARIKAEILSRDDAKAAGQDLLIRLTSADPAPITAASKVRVSVDISGFKSAYGGDWASRLGLKVRPQDCSGAAAGCREQQLVTSRAGDTLSATVPLSAGDTVVALAAGESSGSGDFSATPMTASSTWSATGSSGGFSWSYGMRVPPALGGPVPNVSLAYNSQAVDGRTATTNGQPSWIGEGFDWDPGYIERRYISCGEDMSGSPAPNNTTKTGDLCWRNYNATLSLKGTATELVFNATEGLWHGRTEDGSKIERVTGAVNDDEGGSGDTGEHWVLTTTEGTKYYFGLNRLEGWTTGKPVTNSVQTVPVYGNHSGEPCHATTFAASECMQAYRWNLDYVVDTHGNTMSLWWNRDSNSYGERMSETTLRSYTRDATLARIDYGTHQRTLVNGNKTDTVYTNLPVPMRVGFTPGDRCLTNCTTHDDNWPDTPWDLSCTASPCDNHSPTFWSTRRLQQVQTEIWDAPTSQMVPVERWTLTHTYPDPGDGTRAGLWLEQVAHAGVVGGGNVAMPVVKFDPVMLANRVDTSLINGLRPMNWARMAAITTETGGVIGISYKPTECAHGALPTPHTNTKRCYPVRWAPEDLGGTPGQEITDWFHKYVVGEVAESDSVLQSAGPNPSKVTRYEYLGGAAWRYAEDDAFTKDKYRTWNQWRGYGHVQTYLGIGADQSLTEARFFRGMHGDKASPSGGTKTVTLTDSKGLIAAAYPGETIYDHDEYAGQILETGNYASPSASVPYTGTVSKPWRSDPATASQVIDGQTVYARFTNVSDTWEWGTLDGARGDRVTRTHQDFDAWGLTSKITDFGDLSKTGDEKCTATDYARVSTTHLKAYPSRVRTWALTCDTAFTPNRTFTDAEIIDEVRTSYDGQSWGTAPTHGEVTQVDSIKAWTNNAFVPITISRSAYDDYGRITDSWDVDNNRTRTSYVPAADGPVTAFTVLSPLDLVSTTTTLHPAWGVPTLILDTTNNRRTEATYDALGRLEKVWKPGRSKALYANAPTSWNKYTFRNDAPSVIETQELGPNGNMISTFTFYDGLVRKRQTQSLKADGTTGALVTDNFYDTAGRLWRTFGPYAVANAPSTTFSPYPASGYDNIDFWTKTEFDGAGRPLEEIQYSKLSLLWRTSMRYPSVDRKETIPPEGDTVTSEVSDAHGRVTELWQHEGRTTTTAHDTTYYEYDEKGKLERVTNPANSVWEYGYDLRGRKTLVTDPDEGQTVTTYDDAGRVTSTTDSRVPPVTLRYTYDQIGRKVGLYEGTVSPSNRLAKWEYDGLSNAKGMLTSSTRYVGGETGAAYTSAVTALSPFATPSQQKITIPAVEGQALDGDYIYEFGYKPNGDPATYRPAAIGDAGSYSLGWETQTTGYTTTGLPQTLTTSATTWLVTGTTYTEFGELGVITLRDQTANPQVQIGHTYDNQTRRLSKVLVTRDTAPTTVSDLRYAYDDAGGVTQAQETSTVAGQETQCYDHDYLRRLREAWTLASGDCGAVPTSTAAIGGVEKYWTSWSLEEGGNRTQQVQHKTAGDISTKYVYPTGPARPHALTRTTDANDITKANYTYDGAGNTLCRPAGTAVNNCSTGVGSQMLTWNAEGSLASSTDSTGTTTFIYDADGNRLLRKDPTGKTLYLPGQEIRSNTTGTTVISCSRYYMWANKNIAVRTSSATGSDKLTWLVADRQNTSNITIAAAGTQALALRRQDPYGNPRGSTTGTWPSVLDKGYVGGTIDNTGLTHLGAREYDPSLGRFISVDPIIDVNDPQQMNPYAYSTNNPINEADPDGLVPCGADDCGSSVPIAAAPSLSDKICYRRCTPSFTRVVTPNLAIKNINVAQNDPSFAINWFAKAAGAVESYYQTPPRTHFSRGNETVALAAVKVRINGKLHTRMVGFVSSGKINDELLANLQKAGVIVYQAKPGTGATGKGHAEGAAAAYRSDLRLQRHDLGGEIVEVKAYMTSNGACSQKCADDSNRFLRKPGAVTWDGPGKGSYGYVGGRNLDPQTMKELKKAYGLTKGRQFGMATAVRAISQGWGRATGRGPQPIFQGALADEYTGDWQ